MSAAIFLQACGYGTLLRRTAELSNNTNRQAGKTLITNNVGTGDSSRRWGTALQAGTEPVHKDFSNKSTGCMPGRLTQCSHQADGPVFHAGPTLHTTSRSIPILPHQATPRAVTQCLTALARVVILLHRRSAIEANTGVTDVTSSVGV